MKDLIQRLLVKASSVITPLISKVHSPWSKKLIHAYDYREAMKKNLPIGSVILTRTLGELSDPFIPGFWSHVAIYLGDGFVMEATTHGVVKTDIIDVLLTKDYAAAFVPLFALPEQMVAASKFAASQEGKAYDFEFATSDIQKFYCSELVYWAYEQAMNGEPEFTLRKVLGRDTVAPSDFAEAKDKWLCVWRSKSCQGVIAC